MPAVTRSRAYARLLEACGAPGCPVCRALHEHASRYLGALLYEHVTDPATRASLRAARGLCREHVALLVAVPDSAFGAAIIAADLLGRELARLVEARDGLERARRPSGWRRLLARRGRRPGRAAQPSECPACAAVREAEHRQLETIAGSAGDARFERAFGRSDGLCVPHAERLMDCGAPAAAVARVLGLCADRWRSQLEALGGFAAKHDHAHRGAITDVEARAWQLVLELLAGPPGGARDGAARADRPRDRGR